MRGLWVTRERRCGFGASGRRDFRETAGGRGAPDAGRPHFLRRLYKKGGGPGRPRQVFLRIGIWQNRAALDETPAAFVDVRVHQHRVRGKDERRHW